MGVLFHAVKMDKRISPLKFGIGAGLMNYNLVESDIHELETYTQSLQSFSDSDLETLADKAAMSLIKYQDTHKLLIHASSLIKLWNI
jgi:hypothetical protein